MGPIRVWIEGFLRGRYGYEGNRLFRALAVPVLIGAILIAGWLLVGSLKASLLIPPIPRFTSEGAVVRNGVAAVVVCGEKKQRGFEEGLIAATKYAPEPRTGAWGYERRGDCTIWYHRPPGLEQRLNRQERAANPSASSEMLPPGGARRSPSEFQKLPVVEKLPADER